ncbi:hypothetical protein EIN_309330 [Entamoeba invadens IP1]|uniref:COP9 signalosome complex subunit 3 N-terminal helical repeats domain-containing protein n=1 Tax=Entamoeba invadens IP1 TaxID=370355 RepID=A0A0A1TZ10_ENTIV|nr:hypothetical protein EIN_309330 [Entamoeba invadens IP1]ELP84950.1 hypothetical protein EIN_309330 [Entamoeba invadens IP1]|eukprot:XP_004184296.1 hypothetical protein EIN_309330 [Entamoeba invadens IP1]
MEETAGQPLEHFINEIKTLNSLTYEELFQALPKTYEDHLTAFLRLPKDPTFEVYVSRVNSLADQKGDASLLIPFVTVFNTIKQQKMRVLTSIESTALHYLLMTPTNALISFNDFHDVFYTQTTLSTKNLRAFCYWAGCLFLRAKWYEQASSMFYICASTPCPLDAPSVLGIAAVKKLILLMTFTTFKRTIPSPYKYTTPKLYHTIVGQVLKKDLRQLKITTNINYEELNKEGDIELIRVVCQMMKKNIVIQISHTFSVMTLNSLVQKSQIDGKELIEIIESGMREGLDWAVTEDTVYFNTNHKTVADFSKTEQLKLFQDVLVNADEVMIANKKQTDKTNKK